MPQDPRIYSALKFGQRGPEERIQVTTLEVAARSQTDAADALRRASVTGEVYLQTDEDVRRGPAIRTNAHADAIDLMDAFEHQSWCRAKTRGHHDLGGYQGPAYTRFYLEPVMPVTVSGPDEGLNFERTIKPGMKISAPGTPIDGHVILTCASSALDDVPFGMRE
jgi:hypothetical protein